MKKCFFVSDLHGKLSRYQKLFQLLQDEKPDILFIGGDNFPHYISSSSEYNCFYNDVFKHGFSELKRKLNLAYPKVYLILGNDDGAFLEDDLVRDEQNELWIYLHNKSDQYKSFQIYGYNFIPPSPFQLKDWEKYDVSRHIDPGCLPIEEGKHSNELTLHDMKYSNIKKDLKYLVGDRELTKAIFLFHSPPYKTKLDRAALDNKMIEYVPLDVHIGSIAIKRFIKKHQPKLTLHGHVHESARITGSWKDRIGETFCFSAAHDGPELALVRFNLENLEKSSRELL